jgi:PilZ domain-containing protein
MSEDSERREYPRLRHSVPVRYKFISPHVKDAAMDRVCDGVTQNLSMGGMLLLGPIPRLEWLKDLLLGRINIGVNLYFPGNPTPAKVLARVAWVEAAEANAINMNIGLRILEIPPDHRKVLSDFLTKGTSGG